MADRETGGDRKNEALRRCDVIRYKYHDRGYTRYAEIEGALSTGFKDCRGREIFEGDIVTGDGINKAIKSDSETYLVMWNGEQGRWSAVAEIVDDSMPRMCNYGSWRDRKHTAFNLTAKNSHNAYVVSSIYEQYGASSHSILRGLLTRAMAETGEMDARRLDFISTYDPEEAAKL